MKPECIVCHASSDELPLLSLTYQETQFHICPQHFPILIHRPQTLVGILPGAERLKPHVYDE
jgi:hypothetical protein